MAEKIIFWIGALAIGLNAIRFSLVLTSVFIGWIVNRMNWAQHYAYFVDTFEKHDA